MIKRIRCDVFIPDNTTFDGDICIAGNLTAGDNVTVNGLIDVGQNVKFGNNANVTDVYAGGGDYIDRYHPASEGNIEFGENSTIFSIFAEGSVIVGDNSSVFWIREAEKVELGEKTGLIREDYKEK